MSEFKLTEFIEENKNPHDDPLLGIGISAGIKVGFNKALELVEAEIAKIVRPHADSAKNIQDFINRLRQMSKEQISQSFFREFKEKKLSLWQQVRLFFAYTACYYDSDRGMWVIYKQMDNCFYYLREGKPSGFIKGKSK